MKYYTTTTEFNCGMDLHARQMYVCVMDRSGKKLVHTNILGNDFDFFLRQVEPYRRDLTVVCECTFNWYWLADACQNAGLTFVLAHALSSRLLGMTGPIPIESEWVFSRLASQAVDRNQAARFRRRR
jgi:hypothetical protein